MERYERRQDEPAGPLDGFKYNQNGSLKRHPDLPKLQEGDFVSQSEHVVPSQTISAFPHFSLWSLNKAEMNPQPPLDSSDCNHLAGPLILLILIYSSVLAS